MPTNSKEYIYNIFIYCPIISRSKDNQTMKFDQLIEYNMRDIFLEISYTKCGRKTIVRPISEKIKIEQIEYISGSIF